MLLKSRLRSKGLSSTLFNFAVFVAFRCSSNRRSHNVEQCTSLHICHFCTEYRHSEQACCTPIHSARLIRYAAFHLVITTNCFIAYPLYIPYASKDINKGPRGDVMILDPYISSLLFYTSLIIDTLW